MKAYRSFVLTALVWALAAAWMSGCSKEEPPAPVRTAESPPEKEVQPAPEETGPAAEEQGKSAIPPGDLPPGYTERKLSGGYLPTVVDAYTISRAKVPLINLRNQIKNFHAMEGRYPESLKELADWQKTTIPDLPSRLEFRYSAETGDVVVVEIPKE